MCKLVWLLVVVIVVWFWMWWSWILVVMLMVILPVINCAQLQKRSKVRLHNFLVGLMVILEGV